MAYQMPPHRIAALQWSIYTKIQKLLKHAASQ
ncbi:MAG: hypothetical protein RL244_1574 [Pseudomonadota bacterium]|jgi:hypothetical protein